MRKEQERSFRRNGEVVAKKTAAEVLEQLAKHEGGDIAKVVTKDAAEEATEAAAKKVIKKLSYKIGESDGGPGS